MGHNHSHTHGHDHGPSHGSGHSHAHAGPDNQARVGWVALLTGGFMVVEAVGGVLSGSLALLADAGHMLIDAAALALAWLAFRVARRPSDWKRTYGFHRFQVLAAYSNGLTLFFIALAIAYEAFHRLREPGEVLGGPMLAVAVAGLAVNIAAFLVLHGADRESLNVRGAMLHVLGDLLGSAAAIVAALVIVWTGWTPIDPLLSVLVVVLILRSAWFLVAESGHILLEAAPKGLDVEAMRNELVAAIPGVEDVHHVHAWSLTEDKRMVTLHARVAETADAAEAARLAAAIKSHLRARYAITHATVEIECEQCSDEARQAPSRQDVRVNKPSPGCAPSRFWLQATRVSAGHHMAEQTIRFEDGAAYEQMMGVWSRSAGEVFLDWLAPAADLRWIDVGCGNGAFTELLVERCAPAEVQGIDPSEGQLAFARTRLAGRQAQFRQGDAMALPFPASSFDAAVMALVIVFVPDPAKGIAEMLRVVKPGGTVATYMWDMQGGGFPMYPILVEMRAMGVLPPRPPQVDASRMEVLRGLWAGAGLEAVEAREITVYRTFPSFDDFWRIKMTAPTLGPTVEAMVPADAEALKARVRARLPADADGRITYAARANAIRGRRPG